MKKVLLGAAVLGAIVAGSVQAQVPADRSVVYRKAGFQIMANHVGRVLFIHMDSEAPSATQKAWIQGVVDTAANDPDVDWIISVLHRPYQAEQYVGDISTWLRNEVMPILSSTRKHVLNVAGHHHLYARGQTRDYPTYHMISGGTAWDQFWGQSTERDFDDVQKTIANWTWQLVEIDNETKEMTVRSFSEAHPKLGFVYQSRQTDSFHRNLDKGAPARPAITDSLGTPGAPTTVLLPYTFHSAPFSSAFGEQLNSTQFQIARDATFGSLVLDKLRDVENLYGDTGAPLYEPIDINAGIDILSFEVASRGLPNGTYFLRLRHRDLVGRRAAVHGRRATVGREAGKGRGAGVEGRRGTAEWRAVRRRAGERGRHELHRS
jgi:hypothetical protein